MTEDAIAIALSQAAFGAVTLMFIAYSTIVASKVDERDVEKEKSHIKDYEEAGLPVIINLSSTSTLAPRLFCSVAIFGFRPRFSPWRMSYSSVYPQ